MGKISACLSIILFWGSTLCLAQQDSVYTDTVIIVKDPHIVKKQVYAYDSASVKQHRSLNWGAEIYFLTGSAVVKSKNENQTFTAEAFLNYGLLFTRNIRNFELGAGIGIMNSSFSYSLTKKEYTISSRDTTLSYITDTIISRFNGKDSLIYITDQSDTTFYSLSSKSINNRGQNSYTYLQIPVNIGYKLNIWKHKLNLITRLQLIYNIRLSHNSFENQSPKATIWNYGGQVNLSYSFSKHFSVLLKAQLQRGITQTYTNEFPDYIMSYSYGGGLFFCF